MSVSTIGPRTVAPERVDAELESIWKTLAPASLDEASPVMHASVVSLVAVADSDALADSVTETFVKVVARAPCRFILVNSQPDADPPGLEAQVSVLCDIHADRQTCCELIRLRATGFSADTLPTAVQAYFAPDLPIMLWWPAPLDRSDLASFAASTDRFVIDSRTFARAELGRAAALVQESRRTRTAVSDLNWLRLTPYRQVFAQFFDSAECLGYLSQIESVTIEAREAAGWLMAGWLLSRLDREPNTIRPDQIAVTVNASDERVFRTIVMQCREAEFSVERVDGDTVQARMRLPGETSSRVLRVPLLSVDRLLADEVGRSGRDRAYDAAVAAAAS